MSFIRAIYISGKFEQTTLAHLFLVEGIRYLDHLVD